MFFIIFGKVLTESGMSGALIRNIRANDLDFSTIFLFNLFVSLVMMFCLIVASGSIASFYDDKELKIALIISSFVLPINAFQFVQNAKLVKEFKFKKKAIYEIIAIILSASIAITLALNEFGIWSVVILQISTAFFISLLLWVFEGGIGRWIFNLSSFKQHYNFGINTTLTSLINTSFDNIYQLILGRYFSLAQTGLFFQAKKLQEIPVNVFSSLVHGVFYSSLSKIQEDTQVFKSQFLKILTILISFFGLLCLLIIYYSENIVLLLYGLEWIGSVFFLNILVAASFFYIIERINHVAFKTYDKTQIILRLEIIKKIVLSLTILVGIINRDIEVLLYGFLISNILSSILNIYFLKSVIPISINEYLLKTSLILFSLGLTYAIFSGINSIFSIEGYSTFFVLPVLIVFYFLVLKFFRVIDFFAEIYMHNSYIKMK